MGKNQPTGSLVNLDDAKRGVTPNVLKFQFFPDSIRETMGAEYSISPGIRRRYPTVMYVSDSERTMELNLVLRALTGGEVGASASEVADAVSLLRKMSVLDPSLGRPPTVSLALVTGVSLTGVITGLSDIVYRDSFIDANGEEQARGAEVRVLLLEVGTQPQQAVVIPRPAQEIGVVHRVKKGDQPSDAFDDDDYHS